MDLDARREKKFKHVCQMADVLDNGLCFVNVPKEGGLFYLQVLVYFGMDDETKPHLRESAHSLEHLVAKFTSVDFPDSVTNSKTMDGLGVRKNAFTTPYCTGYHATGLCAALPQTLDLMINAFADFKVDHKVFANEMHAVENELRSHISDTWHAFDQAVDTALYNGTARTTTTEQRLDNVQRLTPQLLIELFETHYYAGNMACIYCGPSQHAAEIRSHFALLPKSLDATSQNRPLPTVQYNQRLMVRTAADVDAARVHIAYALRLKYSLADNATCHCLVSLLTHGFSSRLYRSLRTRHGLVYSVGSYSELSRETQSSWFHVVAQCKRSDVDRVITIVQDQLNHLTEIPPSSCELRKWRNQRRTFHAEAQYWSPQQMAENLQWYVHHKIPLPTLPQLLAADIAVTAEHLQSLTHKMTPARRIVIHNGEGANDNVARLLP